MPKKEVSREKALEVIRDFMSLDPLSLYDYFICGSIRRKKSRVGDVDVIMIGEFPDGGKVQKHKEIGGKKSRTYNYKGVQINIWVCLPAQLGSFLLYATGSGEFNTVLRTIAKDSNMKLSQYGLFHRKTNKLITRISEKGIFNKLGYNYIPPEERNTDKLRFKLRAYEMRTKNDVSYRERILGRVKDKTIYPKELWSILPLSIPVGLLKDFVKGGK
jgi:DNA polymerase/3'-5' exonuclease PolX